MCVCVTSIHSSLYLPDDYFKPKNPNKYKYMTATTASTKLFGLICRKKLNKEIVLYFMGFLLFGDGSNNI